MKLIRLLILFAGSFLFKNSQAQPVSLNGISDKTGTHYILSNARIVVSPLRTISKGSIEIKDGKILTVQEGNISNSAATVIDMSGKSIYPSFIDIYSHYGIPEARKNDKGPAQQYASAKKGAYYWNQAIKEETDASQLFVADPKQAQILRQLGFGVVISHQMDGIARGSSVMLSLADGRENELLLRKNVSMHYAFNKGKSTQDYPHSLMGSIVLLRQAYYDARWYGDKKSSVQEQNITLQAMNEFWNLPKVFEVSDRNNAIRAAKLGEEFQLKYIIKGAGDEYRNIPELQKYAAALIVPLNFPAAYQFNSLWDERQISLQQMKHWEMAAANLKLLIDAKIPVALTLEGLKDPKEFWNNLRKASRYGISEMDLLAALSSTPARILKIDNLCGSLEAGKLANFLICSSSPFEDSNVVFENWVLGVPYRLNSYELHAIKGTYNLKLSDSSYQLILGGYANNLSASMKGASTESIPVTARFETDFIHLSISLKKGAKAISLSGWKTATGLAGAGSDSSGHQFSWTATLIAPQAAPRSNRDSLQLSIPKPGKLLPYVYANKTNSYLIRNCTVWTSEKEGKLENTDVLVVNGKISKIGKNLAANGIEIIDGSGKHLTAGFIDEHSHIAIEGGVNEGTQSITSEVRIADVINPDDINIYRQLAGGVTTSHLLHGSANAIGGQTTLIKLRWGQTAGFMKYDAYDPFIKFALGENVKQSNWGDVNTTRFPQTRMGVEQVFMDGFTRAVEYRKQWADFNSGKSKNKPRRDLELDALVEILESKRFITCHSYVQSEINMLMHVADSFGFKVNTFTHILEGYKVADKMKVHGVGASTFADWWAYKMEVIEAIPYNAALLNRMGLITAINSDDAEMGRRLNHEAAKTVKYGGVSETDALNMITINPAKLLHIDHRTGSIKAGKDADLVLWNGHPLSNYSRVEKTFVDGICYFDRSMDSLEQIKIKNERNELKLKMQDALNKGEKSAEPQAKPAKHYHCESIFDFWREEEVH